MSPTIRPYDCSQGVERLTYNITQKSCAKRNLSSGILMSFATIPFHLRMCQLKDITHTPELICNDSYLPWTIGLNVSHHMIQPKNMPDPYFDGRQRSWKVALSAWADIQWSTSPTDHWLPCHQIQSFLPGGCIGIVHHFAIFLQSFLHPFVPSRIAAKLQIIMRGPRQCSETSTLSLHPMLLPWHATIFTHLLIVLEDPLIHSLSIVALIFFFIFRCCSAIYTRLFSFLIPFFT